MKGIPLWQPWASLVAVGAKRVETRSWPAPAELIGQRIAIYATKTRDHLDLCLDPPFNKYVPNKDGLPLGAIVATAVVARTGAMYPDTIAKLREQNPDEYAFGLYEIGRFAWVLQDVELIDPAIPFTWPVQGPAKYIDVPDDLVGYTPPDPAQGALL